MSVGSLANTTLTWRRPTYPADGSARVIVTLGTLLARVQPLAGREAQQYGRELELTPVMVYVEGQVPVQIEDELILPDGLSLLVRHVRDPDLLGRYTAITCEGQR